ncbi:MAG: hypothetical protein HYZ14_11790 [Bacteroidetes bacterium]|nr:hypothetical protein [Bacteroidota bacterium]
MAAETETSGSSWLYDFFSGGIHSAYAEYAIALSPPINSSAQYYQQMSYSIGYIAAEKTYEMRFSYEYREDWSILTHNGSFQPPKQQVYFTGSKIQPWSNTNGLGIYAEKYDRKIQNWVVFENLDSILMMQSKAGNPMPPLSGIFFPDELKHLKRKYKEALASGTEDPLCRNLDFDHSGNVAGISQSYLMTFNNRKTNAVKNLDDYTLSIRNQNDDVVFIDILTTGGKYPMMEGLQFKSGEKKCTVFNFELNHLFSKFAPGLVEDPQKLINEYLLALQDSAGKPLARFETTAHK